MEFYELPLLSEFFAVFSLLQKFGQKELMTFSKTTLSGVNP